VSFCGADCGSIFSSNSSDKNQIIHRYFLNIILNFKRAARILKIDEEQLRIIFKKYRWIIWFLSDELDENIDPQSAPQKLTSSLFDDVLIEVNK
jgi:hypothetical protein